MLSPDSLMQIRENERQSHIQMYSNSVLYKDKGWLFKPVQSITKLIPLFENQSHVHILDLGVGSGEIVYSLQTNCKVKTV